MDWQEYWGRSWSLFPVVVFVVVALVLLTGAIMALLRLWLNFEPRRVWVAERRMHRLGRLARLDAALLEAGQEPTFVEAEAKRQQRRDKREDTFLDWMNP